MSLRRNIEINTNDGAIGVSDLFVASLWITTILGLLEGIMLAALRIFPTIHAAKKTSLHVIWIAPVLHLLTCFIILFFVAVGIQRFCDRSQKRLLVFICGLICFISSFSVIASSGIIHLAAAAILATGVSILLSREFLKRNRRLLDIMRKRIILIPVLIALACLVSSIYPWAREVRMNRHRPKSHSDTPNVILIVLDTVRYDIFGPRNKPSLTPNMDRMTSQGVSYEQAWPTSSWSLTSQASILTGYYPHEHGAIWPNLKMDPKIPTLAEFLYRRGYSTGAFSGNSSWITPEYVGRGFMRFKAYTLEEIMRRTTIGKIADRVLNKIGMHYAGRGTFAPRIHRQLTDYLEDYPKDPFFIFICYMDVNHNLYDRQFNSRWGQIAPPAEVFDAYKLGLRRVDANINNLFNILRLHGKLDNTIVIITSDHGQSFGPDIQNDRAPSGHGTSLYPEQCQVPLIIWYPKKLKGDVVVKRTVSLHRIPSTIMSLIGLDNTPFVGEPLPLSTDEKSLAEKDSSAYLVLRYEDRNVHSIVSNGWQYIVSKNKNGEVNEELFRVAGVQHPTKVTNPDNSLLKEMRMNLCSYLPYESGIFRDN